MSASKFSQRFNGGNWFIFYRPLVHVTACKLDALFLQDLINIASMPGTVTKEIDDKTYFLCTTEFLERSGIGWTVKEQKTRFAALREAGLLQSVKVGIPPRRWVWIDEEKIEAEIDGKVDAYRSGPNGTEQTVPNGPQRPGPNGTEHSRRNKEGRKKEGTGRVAAFPPTSDETNLRRVDKLRRGLRSKKIPCYISTSSRHKQAGEFNKLEKKIGTRRLDAALIYFIENVDDPELPVLSGAKEFCNGCFNWIDKKARNAGALPEDEIEELESEEIVLPDGKKRTRVHFNRRA